MTLAADPYAATVSGYVITALLGIIGAGAGYFQRQTNKALEQITKRLAGLDRKTEVTDQNVAILLDRDRARHPGQGQPRR